MLIRVLVCVRVCGCACVRACGCRLCLCLCRLLSSVSRLIAKESTRDLKQAGEPRQFIVARILDFVFFILPHTLFIFFYIFERLA